MSFVVFRRVLLRHEDISFFAKPTTRPRLVRPSETKAEIRFSKVGHVVDWSSEEAPSVEPIMPIAESLDTMATSHISLRLPNLREPEIVETQVSGQMGLVVEPEQRFAPRDEGPLGEALAPPGVVFENWMELGQIERDNPSDVIVLTSILGCHCVR